MYYHISYEQFLLGSTVLVKKYLQYLFKCIILCFKSSITQCTFMVVLIPKHVLFMPLFFFPWSWICWNMSILLTFLFIWDHCRVPKWKGCPCCFKNCSRLPWKRWHLQKSKSAGFYWMHNLVLEALTFSTKCNLLSLSTTDQGFPIWAVSTTLYMYPKDYIYWYKNKLTVVAITTIYTENQLYFACDKYSRE